MTPEYYAKIGTLETHLQLAQLRSDLTELLPTSAKAMEFLAGLWPLRLDPALMNYLYTNLLENLTSRVLHRKLPITTAWVLPHPAHSLPLWNAASPLQYFLFSSDKESHLSSLDSKTLQDLTRTCFIYLPESEVFSMLVRELQNRKLDDQKQFCRNYFYLDEFKAAANAPMDSSLRKSLQKLIAAYGLTFEQYEGLLAEHLLTKKYK